MGLDDSVLKFVGAVVDVHPFYGWGWAAFGKDYTVPPPFRLRIIRFFEVSEERRGGVGRVEEPGHALDGHWVVFATRHSGVFDLERRLAYYQLYISSDEPIDAENGWPQSPDAQSIIVGYADIIRARDDVPLWRKAESA